VRRRAKLEDRIGLRLGERGGEVLERSGEKSFFDAIADIGQLVYGLSEPLELAGPRAFRVTLYLRGAAQRDTGLDRRPNERDTKSKAIFPGRSQLRHLPVSRCEVQGRA